MEKYFFWKKCMFKNIFLSLFLLIVGTHYNFYKNKSKDLEIKLDIKKNI